MALSLPIPAAVTGTLDRENPADRFRIECQSGERLSVAVHSRSLGSPLDVAVKVLDPDGKELAANDDLPGTTDAGLEFQAPADGNFELVVSDVSGARPSLLNIYRLVVRRAEPDFALQMPPRLNVPIGEKTELTIKAVRTGGFEGPIALAISGLPPGISVPSELVVPAGQAELKIPLESAAEAPSEAALVRIEGRAATSDRTVSHRAVPAAGNFGPAFSGRSGSRNHAGRQHDEAGDPDPGSRDR